MKETSKATLRRIKETDTGLFNWSNVFCGKAIDIGCGNDMLPPLYGITEVVPFDLAQGDANKIDEILPPESFDLVHSSQVLEHMFNPHDAFRRWAKLLKVRGHMVITVPDYDLYEQQMYKGMSLWNADHKSTWSLWRRIPPTILTHVFIPHLLLSPDCWPWNTPPSIKQLKLIDEGYDYMKIHTLVDQTLAHAEAFIEIVVQRL